MELSAWHMWWKRTGVKELRALAMAEWDPIGVAEWAEVADEYDSYLLPMVEMLRGGASSDEIAGYLRAAREDMGLDQDAPTDLRASELIVAWYRRSTARHQNAV